MIDLKLLESVADERLGQFAEYADDHELFLLFHEMLRQLLIHKPKDPLLWMADFMEKRPLPSIIVVAPPTANETGLCKTLAAAMNAVHVSTTSLLQVAIERKTSLGMQALPAFSQHQLVSDRIMTELLMLRLAQPDVQERGFVLEGYPRTRDQALALQRKGIVASNVLILDWPASALLDQAAHQFIDPVTNRAYDVRVHTEIDADVRARLTQKMSLTEAMVQDRLTAYHRHLPGILDTLKMHVRIPVPHAPGACVLASATGERALESAGLEPVLDAIAQMLKVRLPSAGATTHRVLLCGGSKEVQARLGEMMEAHFQLVFVSPHRLFAEEVSRHGPRAAEFAAALAGKSTLPDVEIAQLLHDRLQQPDAARHGWVLTATDNGWTPALLDKLAALGVRPSRVLVIAHDSDHWGADEVSDPVWQAVIQDRFHAPMHPFFVKANKHPPTGGKLQTVVVDADEPVGQVVERVRQVLLRPVEYHVPRMY
ncbi:Adenylate kinase 8 [Allomyces arbusculus]|nr:Adenylate kinase 8 [Allomyces arbusculus]